MADIELLKRLAEAAYEAAPFPDMKKLGAAHRKFYAKAGPEVVLALIAENEENAANLAQWQKAFVRIAGELSVLAAQHGDFTDESTLQQAIDFLKGAMAERDRLKDELERVRADAERLDWLLHNISGRALRAVGVILSGDRELDRAAVDAAMGKGGRADV